MELLRDLLLSRQVAAKLQTFGEAVQDSQPVSGLTHNFYRYPARFSPLLAKTVIEAFTEAGEWVLDPFMGGGTTLVEARSLGRNSIGTDISELACFVSKAKTMLVSEEDLREVNDWSCSLVGKLNLRRRVPPLEGSLKHSEQLKYLYGRKTWPIRKAIQLALSELTTLPKPKQRQLARCVLLKTAQWALDGRSRIPSCGDFRDRLTANAREMSLGLQEFNRAVLGQADRLGYVPVVHCCTMPAASLGELELLQVVKPKLVLTSPPYPGIHVLYHRWQIDGGKETGAPFWISGTLDGKAASHYTFGDRRQHGLTNYYLRLRESFEALNSLIADDAVVVQLVAFSSPEMQLERYLSIMKDAGFREVLLPRRRTCGDGRLWRVVPNRKWYAHRTTGASRRLEVVLVHVKSTRRLPRIHPVQSTPHPDGPER